MQPFGGASAALARAKQADRLRRAEAVDLYYQAAALAASDLGQCPTASGCENEAECVYREALTGLVVAGQRYGRLDPRRGLIVFACGSRRVVPTRYVGFAWRADDFSRLIPAAGQTNRDIAHRYNRPGLGVSLVGERIAPCRDELFFRPWQPFAVTAVLRPVDNDSDDSLGAAARGEHMLEFYNPLAVDTIPWGRCSRPLSRDLTAPLAAIVNEAPRQYLRGFTAPSDTRVRPQLVMLEPYQRGKIPVVFIHGLYSDPITWADMINDLRAQSDLYDEYQFWTFRYPTGGEVLASAAALRRSLALARDAFDPDRADPAMDRIVLVGHSLGGLVAKMQVSTSYDLLWREFALRPFDDVRASPELLDRLASGFFFEAAPSVERVIFIGAPHRGSGMTRRVAGRVGNALIRFGADEDAAYQELMEQNPGVFKPSVARRRPTTIALLEPDSPLLAALARMPVQCTTRMHSIIGTGGTNPLGEPGDGVVSVSSARHYGDSEIFVPAKHEKLHRDPRAICEVMRILRLHAIAGT